MILEAAPPLLAFPERIMKRIVALVGLLLCPLAAPAQERIGYANLELILALMPETKQVNDELVELRKKLAKGLETKQAYAQQKLIEAQEAAEAGVASEERMLAYEQELRGLEREIQTSAAEAEQKIVSRRAELMSPVSDKLQTTIRSVAETDGYTYILNSVDGSGTSIVLYGQEEKDLTRRILKELGVEPPKEAATAE